MAVRLWLALNGIGIAACVVGLGTPGAQAADQHWSLVAPSRPALPAVKDTAWPCNPIDGFVLARLEREGLAPSPQADRERLIRRVTFDLTGLPPTPEEVDAFLGDESPNAYERLVDRLLASPRYGERMATPWLDAARYADTSGYQNDGPRQMWRWRDWLIDALNANMPFDQFTIEQLAGDLLPNATLEQRIATGFNRNHRGNAEGGIIPEEYAVEYVVDRVETTSTVWIGLTLGCARCHDHKYDPFSQREFYQLFAYFNNVPEFGRAIKVGNSPPFIKAPTRHQQGELEQIQSRLIAAERHVGEVEPQLAAAQSAWEQSQDSQSATDWSPSEGIVAHYPLDGQLGDQSGHSKEGTYRDGQAVFGPGRLGQAAVLDGQKFIDAGDVAKFGYFDKFSLAAWILMDGDHGGTVLSRMKDETEGEGYSVTVHDGRIHVQLIKRWLDDAIRVQTQRTLNAAAWHHVMVTYDGSSVAGGLQVYVDGIAEPLDVQLDALNQTFSTTEPLRIGAGGGPAARFHGSIDDVRIYGRCVSPDEVVSLSTGESIQEIIKVAPSARTPGQRHKLRAFYLQHHAPDPVRAAHQQLHALLEERAQKLESVSTVMVMQERPAARDTFVLERGQYDRPGEKVETGVPAALPALPAGAENNRLRLARWLVDPSHPLTARVAVNRYWQIFFGTGLVKTTEDFGTQGEPPSHGELLDWLATELVRNSWDVKAMQRAIVTSAMYRQSSRATPELQRRDSENRLLARGARFRLPAEMVRDNALAASGLLVERLGGPSVKPYQPDGLWKEIATDVEYGQGSGADLYRRSLYTFWKRTVTSPSMTSFDATNRETCTVMRSRTNTPLQALVLMNDVTFIEAARALAERIMTEGGTGIEERLTWAMRLATARRPTQAELQVLRESFAQHLAYYQQDPDAAKELASAGQLRRNEALPASELAAYTTVATTILNLDEVITKE